MNAGELYYNLYIYYHAVERIVQLNPSITDTIGSQNFVHYREVLRGFQYISGKRGMRNLAVEHNVAAFSELPLLYAGREG